MIQIEIADIKKFEKLYSITGQLEMPLNCLMVKYNIRKSFLIGLGFTDSHKKSANKIIDYIKDSWKEFKIVKLKGQKFSNRLDSALITKVETEIPFDVNNYTHQELGKILGYPCAGDIIRERDFFYRISGTYKNKTDLIFGMVCGESSKHKLKPFSDKIEYFIDELNNYLKDKILIKVDVRNLEIMELINLIKNNIINKDVKKEVDNLFKLYNFGIFIILRQNGVLDIYDPKYRSLLVTVLIMCKTDYTYAYDKTSTDLIKRVGFVLDILRIEYGILIKENLIVEAYKFDKNIE